jgi:hypothetical protein
MKSVTEFWNVTLIKGINAKTALAAEGKTPEEISTSLGEKFKMEGDKLKYFVSAIEVAGQNMEKLSRILVVSLNEGEKAPAKAVKVEEMHYVPEFQAAPGGVVTKKDKMAAQKDNKKGKGGPKESPWGLSPEQKAAKKAGKGGGTTTPPAAT